MINRVTLLGNLTRDAETLSGSQTTVSRLRLATHTSWRDANGEWQRRAEFHSLVAFGDLAERCSVRATKGRRVYVEGHLRTREWTGSDGLRRTSTEVVVDSVRYLDAPDGGDALVEVDDVEGEPATAAGHAPSTTTAARTVRVRASGRRSAQHETVSGGAVEAAAADLEPEAAPIELELTTAAGSS